MSDEMVKAWVPETVEQFRQRKWIFAVMKHTDV